MSLELDIQPLDVFAGKGTFASITHGVKRDPFLVWDFIAVSEHTDNVLIGFKQAARKDFFLLVNAEGASLCISEAEWVV